MIICVLVPPLETFILGVRADGWEDLSRLSFVWKANTKPSFSHLVPELVFFSSFRIYVLLFIY